MTHQTLAPAPTAPSPVRTAVALVYARIAVTLLGLVVGFVYADAVTAAATEAAEAAGGPVDSGLMSSFTSLGLAVDVVLSLVAVAVWVLLAVFTRKGHGWARIVLTVIGGLSLLGSLVALGTLALDMAQGVPPAVTAVLQLLSAGLWVTTIVLLFRPASNAFFRAAAAARAGRPA